MSKFYEATQARTKVKAFFREMVPDSVVKEFNAVAQERFPELLKETKMLRDKLDVTDEVSHLEMERLCQEYVEKSKSLIIKVSVELMTRAVTTNNSSIK